MKQHHTDQRDLEHARRRAVCASLLAGMFGLLLLPASVWAAGTQPVLELSVHKIVPAQGNTPERQEPADAARAGDILEYQAVYRNASAQTVRNAQVTLPVPSNGAEYLLDAVLPAAPLASTDGKRYAATPLLRAQAGPDGKPVQKPAPAADYRFLRWDIGDLAPGASRTVRARVQLLPVGASR